MGRKYKIRNSNGIYFVTFTIVEWIPIFKEEAFIHIFLESIRFCQKNKGLEVYSWVIMPNHVHMIIGRNGTIPLPDIIRDFKGFTSRKIKKELDSEQSGLVYQIMRQSGLINSRNKNFQLWMQHNHPVELDSESIFNQKVDYIHNNPVVAGLSSTPEDWQWSSAIDFHGEKGLLDLTWS